MLATRRRSVRLCKQREVPWFSLNVLLLFRLSALKNVRKRLRRRLLAQWTLLLMLEETEEEAVEAAADEHEGLSCEWICRLLLWLLLLLGLL